MFTSEVNDAFCSQKKKNPKQNRERFVSVKSFSHFCQDIRHLLCQLLSCSVARSLAQADFLFPCDLNIAALRWGYVSSGIEDNVLSGN